MADIFLSYAREDLPQARQIARALESTGWDVWWDRDLLPGVDFRAEIERQLNEVSCVIVLWSKTSVASSFVKDEADHSMKRGVLVQALIEDVRPPFGFGQQNWANLSNWNNDSASEDFKSLCAGVAHHVKRKRMAADAAAEQAKRDREARAAREEAERQAALAKEAAGRARRDASAMLAQAATAVREKRYDAAKELVEEARRLDAGHPELVEWVTRIADAIAADATAEEARRAREAEEAERQAELVKKAAERARRDADAKLERAARAIEDKRYDAAAKFVDAARLIDPGHPQLSESATRVSDAIAADVAADQARQEREAEVARERAAAVKEAGDRARRDADAKLSLAASNFEAKRYEAAKKLVDAARVIYPDHPDLESWATRIGDAIADAAAAERERKERERKEQERKERERKEREPKPSPGGEEDEAGVRPAWIKYAAAAAVLAVAITGASVLLRTDPPSNADQPPSSTGGGAQVPVPPTDPPSQSGSGNGANAGPDRGSQPPGSKGEEPAIGRGRGSARNSGSTPSGPDSPRPGAGPASGPATPNNAQPPTSPADPPPANPPVRGTPPPTPPIVKVDPIAEAERKKAELDRQKAAELERQKTEELERQKTAELERLKKAEMAEIAEIRKLLDAYKDAYEDLDDRRVRAIVPGFKGIPSRMLIKKVSVTFTDPRIVVIGLQATVIAPVTYRYEWNRAGNPPTSDSRSLTWNLQKDGSRWRVISSN